MRLQCCYRTDYVLVSLRRNRLLFAQRCTGDNNLLLHWAADRVIFTGYTKGKNMPKGPMFVLAYATRVTILLNRLDFVSPNLII